MSKVIIVGEGKIADEIYHYLKNDSDHEITAFTADEKYISKETKFDLPVVPFASVETIYPPSEYKVLVAIGYQELNRLRTEKYFEAKKKGYSFINYVSSRASNVGNVEIGENCIILENNTINTTAKIGNNVILWCGNHIGHHSVIEDNCFLAGQVVISGVTKINSNCFIGVNATIGHQITIGEKNLIGARTLITKNTEPNSVFISQDTQKFRLDSNSFLKLTKL